ncbi:MAG: Uncharacterised protein [Synechococcus sp. CC9902]|nr:MAG: Uncharacterised protein [Synechococcus sp. CC9902]
MHGLHMGNQPHGVMGHRCGDAPQRAGRKLGVQRLDGDAIVPGPIERRHIDPWHLRQITQQIEPAQTCFFGLRHHKTDLRQQFLAVTQRDEIEKCRIGLRIAGGSGAAGKDQRWR